MFNGGLTWLVCAVHVNPYMKSNYNIITLNWGQWTQTLSPALIGERLQEAH